MYGTFDILKTIRTSVVTIDLIIIIDTHEVDELLPPQSSDLLCS